MANTYPATPLLLHHWGSVDAPTSHPSTPTRLPARPGGQPRPHLRPRPGRTLHPARSARRPRPLNRPHRSGVGRAATDGWVCGLDHRLVSAHPPVHQGARWRERGRVLEPDEAGQPYSPNHAAAHHPAGRLRGSPVAAGCAPAQRRQQSRAPRHMTIVIVLEGSPEPERVYAAFARATEQLPRMTQRVRTAPLTGVTSWRADARFAIAQPHSCLTSPWRWLVVGDSRSGRPARHGEVPGSPSPVGCHPLWRSRCQRLGARAEGSPCCRRRGSPAANAHVPSRTGSGPTGVTFASASRADTCSWAPRLRRRPRSGRGASCGGSTRSSGAVLPVLPFCRITSRRRCVGHQ